MKGSFKVYQKLMSHRIQNILVVSNPYDAFVMEEDGGLMEHVFTSYRGISLINPPKFTLVSTGKEALEKVLTEEIDLVITLDHVRDTDALTIGRQIKSVKPTLPVVLLLPSTKAYAEYSDKNIDDCIDKIFIWSGNKNVLWAIVKWVEDRLNILPDTQAADVRVLILVEDSPMYYSSLLPLVYEIILTQTQSLLDDTLNEEHRLMRLRARPKIVLAKDYEEAWNLYKTYKPYLLGIFSDIRFPMKGKLQADAGIQLVRNIKEKNPYLPCLLLSSEKSNAEKAADVNAHFIDKNSDFLNSELRKFLVNHLGFGDFIFITPDGEKVGMASNLVTLEKALMSIPDSSLEYHSRKNHFSGWLMAHSEIDLASKLKETNIEDYDSIAHLRDELVNMIHEKRMRLHRGVVAQFRDEFFDPEAEFLKLGEGSLGGKARGIAFMAKSIQKNRHYFKNFSNLYVAIPKTMVITTEYFDRFMDENELTHFSEKEIDDKKVVTAFLKAKLPKELKTSLKLYLEQINYPLAVRSSSLLEDSNYEPYAGLYSTYMLKNSHEDLRKRINELAKAIKLIYASVFMSGAKSYARATLHRTEEEKMAVIIQQLTANRYNDKYYPVLSGVAQSKNFYAISPMKPAEGIVHMALGLGKTVVEGERVLRFCPSHPKNLPQFSHVEDYLDHTQKNFYALDLSDPKTSLEPHEKSNLSKHSIFDSLNEDPVRIMSSFYSGDNNSISDAFKRDATPIITFANVLKYDLFPLSEALKYLLELGKAGLGNDFEMEFAMKLTEGTKKAELNILQIRPMAIRQNLSKENFKAKEKKDALCYTGHALGEGKSTPITHVVIVDPEMVTSTNTRKVVQEISKINRKFRQKNQKYLLAGPGRWGSSDPMLGIPVAWQDISEVQAIIEASVPHFRSDPSQGTHFFQNITSLGVHYMTVYKESDFFNWQWFKERGKKTDEKSFLYLLELETPLIIKVNNLKHEGILISQNNEEL